MPHSIVTFGVEDSEVKVINDHFIVVKALKSDTFDFGDDGLEKIGTLKPETLADVADQYRGIPIYVDHQRTKYDQVGVVRSAFFKNPFIYAVVELYSRTEDQKRIIEHIKKGEIKAVSSGFNFEYMDVGGNKIDIFNVNPFEVSLMLDWMPKCPECTMDYRNFGVKVETMGEKTGETTNTPLVWLETCEDGCQNIVISEEASKYGLSEPLLEALNVQREDEEEMGEDESTEEVAEIPEISIEVEGDLSNITIEVLYDSEDSNNEESS